MDAAEVAGLVRRAAQGDQRAWQGIVDQYSSLVWSVARGFRLSEAQTADAVQTTWLRLVEHLAEIREPERLPGWLRTTTRRACLATARQSRRERPVDAAEQSSAFDHGGHLDDAGPETNALRQDQQVLIRRAVATLPPRHRALLGMLVSSPPVSYEEISAGLGIPVGSIGPTRARILGRLRTALETAGLHDAALN
ncbi:RNA polymerase sigma factor [Geodermatophilus sp. URMC 61]|uniref:RNA polymerase sigma factor n=1 Tax=Geodermatophilus sp. URMC 61 TaxID=3423411 RepID=UPI00406C3A86